MISWYQIQALFIDKLSLIYGKEEATNLFYWSIEEAFGISRISYAMTKNELLSNSQQKELQIVLERLAKEEPIQYIFNRAYCREQAFYVNKNVLIPRSETESLIALIADKYRDKPVRILDIGTGSGCIAINLQKELPKAQVLAVDISEAAIEIAKKNAKQLQTSVRFEQVDILNTDIWSFVEDASLDIIVSNPPYVRNSEKLQMRKNVLDFEPSEALFVKDENPLVFYEAIANFSMQKLKKTATLFFEINEYLAEETQALLSKKGFQQIEIIKDIYEKNRFVLAKYRI